MMSFLYFFYVGKIVETRQISDGEQNSAVRYFPNVVIPAN